LPNPIGASMDAAWLTRGNGKYTNSKTGHAELIGVFSGEVLASGRRHRHCSLCKTKKPEDHDCHANWTGSSKSMEADIIAYLVANMKGARVTVLVGDEDASTMAKVREVVPWRVLKVTDVVHAKKNFGGALFAAKHKLLTPKIIEYVKDCFSYALHQNKDKPEEVKAAILNIPCHIFNDHANCGLWCGFTREPDTYKHKRLPEIWSGSNDAQQSLKNVITNICEKFASKSKSLAPCLSSNVNESFNFVVTTFAPKNKHYAGTNSIDRRIDGAVLQKNGGVEYILSVNKQLNLSPGDHTAKHRMAVARKKKRKSEKSKLPEEKVKRRKSFQLSLNDQLRKESSEGLQYQSGMGFLSVTNPDLEKEVQANEVIPEQEQVSKTKPSRKNLTQKRVAPTGSALAGRVQEGTECEIVVFDTETTGFSGTSEILQLAAQSAQSKFNSYCCPSVTITAEAAKVNKLSFRRGKLYQNGQEVDTLPRKAMLQSFLKFLEEHKKPVLLVAHNIAFDLRFLWKELKEQDLTEQFLGHFVGYCDSMTIFKCKVPQLESYKLSFVCKNILGADFQFDEHNAAGDVDALFRSLEMLGIGKEVGLKFSVSSEVYVKNMEEQKLAKDLVMKLAEKSITLTGCTVKSLVVNQFDFNSLLELSKNKENFCSAVSKCFKQRVAARCEEVYKVFVGLTKPK
jgi:DNA polymerase III epsilon subunit-like protein